MLFPDPRHAAAHGLLALGGSYHPRILLEAYSQGIFPWPSEDMPHAWFSPDPRMVLVPSEVRVSRSLRRALRRGRFEVRWDTAFDQVIEACASAPRPGQDGTWIQEELIRGFKSLHRLGFAHSVEAWYGDELAGGLYGLSIGSLFCGESMFHRRSNASKVAFVHLARRLEAWGFRCVDCQIHTPHLERLGAREWPRDRFLDTVARAIRDPTRRGSWSEDPEPTIPTSETEGRPTTARPEDSEARRD